MSWRNLTSFSMVRIAVSLIGLGVLVSSILAQGPLQPVPPKPPDSPARRLSFPEPILNQTGPRPSRPAPQLAQPLPPQPEIEERDLVVASIVESDAVIDPETGEEITADISVDVNLVQVSAAVTDRDGQPVQGLSREDFELLDNGEPRQLESVWQESDLPLTVGLVVDISGSQRDFWNRHRRAVAQFLGQVLQSGDRAFLVSIGSNGVRLVTDLTSSVEVLRDGVDTLGDRRRNPGPLFGEPCPPQEVPPAYVPIVQSRPANCRGTALWNGVYAAARLRMRNVGGRKAIIVLSDGKDTGSPHSLNDAIEASQSANTPVYSIISTGMGERIFGPLLGALGNRMNGGLDGPGDLNKLSEQTGGRRFWGSDDGSAEVFEQIEQELRSLYVLSFTPPAEARDGAFHELEVNTDRRGVNVRARAGYLAAE